MWIVDYQHLPGVLKFLAGLAAALGLGWGLARLRPQRDRIDALLLILLPASLYVLGAKSLMAAIGAPQFDWSAGRFSPTYSLLRGYTLYYPVEAGPIYNTIYPPMSYLAYLPAAFFKGPTVALMVGAIVGQVLVLGPMLALCLAPHGDRAPSRSPLFSAFVFLGFWKFATTSILQSLICFIHADAPSIGFAALALTVLYARRAEAAPSARTLVSAAVFASLAVWSKQTLAPLFVLLPAWMLLTRGLGAALRFAAWLGATLAAVSAAFVGAFGLKAMLFNVIQLPKSHPWTYAPDYFQGFSIFLTEQFAVCVPPLMGLGTLLYLSAGRASGPEGGPPLAGRAEAIRGYFGRNHWILFAALALAMVPFGQLARIKLGGHINSYVHTLYFLAAAGCLLLLDWHARNTERGLDRVNVALRAVVLAWPLAPLLLVNTELLHQYTGMQDLHRNSQEVAYRYALKHPGEAYFPWNTLSTLMAEGKAYHFEAGMVDRELGHVAPGDAHFRRHIPDRIRVVAYPPNPMCQWTMRYFPDFKRQVVIDELPGWICYER